MSVFSSVDLWFPANARSRLRDMCPYLFIGPEDTVLLLEGLAGTIFRLHVLRILARGASFGGADR
jgi:hypothetical protein